MQEVLTSRFPYTVGKDLGFSRAEVQRILRNSDLLPEIEETMSNAAVVEEYGVWPTPMTAGETRSRMTERTDH